MIVDGVADWAVSIEMLLKKSSTFAWKIVWASFPRTKLLMVNAFCSPSLSFLFCFVL